MVLFQYTSISKHLVVLNRKVEKSAICQGFQGFAVQSSFLIPANDQKKQQYQNQSMRKIQGSFCSAVSFQIRPKWIARMTKWEPCS